MDYLYQVVVNDKDTPLGGRGSRMLSRKVSQDFGGGITQKSEVGRRLPVLSLFQTSGKVGTNTRNSRSG